jgi:hypothetical protein
VCRMGIADACGVSGVHCLHSSSQGLGLRLPSGSGSPPNLSTSSTPASRRQRIRFVSLNLGSIAMGFVGTTLSWFIMNHFGRRTMMVWDCFGLPAL